MTLSASFVYSEPNKLGIGPFSDLVVPEWPVGIRLQKSPKVLTRVNSSVLFPRLLSTGLLKGNGTILRGS
jgi:hypothetical protein